MKKYNDYNLELNAIIENLKEDCETFNRKESYYSHLWEKCQTIENTLNTTDPMWVFDKLYKVWDKAAKRSEFYNQSARLTRREIERLEKVRDHIEMIYIDL